jgi:GNAT superfamily N-acetyltransferase
MDDAAPVTRADAPVLGTVLARAFFDDPLIDWLLPNKDTRDHRLTKFFRTMIRFALIGRGQVWSTPNRSCAAVWIAPSKWRLGLVDMARIAPAIISVFRGAVPRALALQGTMEKAHLEEPHHYLFLLGTDPAQQGRGVGTRLMAPMLTRCDAEGLPAYLESSNPRNLGFYRRHGFVDLGELRVRDSPPMVRMRRPPRKN